MNFKIYLDFILINLPFIIVSLICLFSVIFVYLCDSPILCLVYFNIFVIINVMLLFYPDPSLSGISFVVVYTGATTIPSVPTTIPADHKGSQNLSPTYDNLINFGIFGSLTISTVSTLTLCYSMNKNDFLFANSIPINVDLINFHGEDSSIPIIGYLLCRDFLVIIVLCSLPSICTTIIIIGFKESD